MTHSLEVYYQKQLIFYSDKDWLHPLFDFEKFLKNVSFTHDSLMVKDKIIGRAAALLLQYLGIKHVHAETLSQLGKKILDFFSFDYTYEKLVSEIGCKTEKLLENEWDASKAYKLITERIEAEKSQTASS